MAHSLLLLSTSIEYEMICTLPVEVMSVCLKIHLDGHITYDKNLVSFENAPAEFASFMKDFW